MSWSIQERYKYIRKQFEEQFSQEAEYFDFAIKHIDDFIESADATELEKKFYLLLHQFPGETKPYVIMPHEQVFIKNQCCPV